MFASEPMLVLLICASSNVGRQFCNVSTFSGFKNIDVFCSFCEAQFNYVSQQVDHAEKKANSILGCVSQSTASELKKVILLPLSRTWSAVCSSVPSRTRQTWTY